MTPPVHIARIGMWVMIGMLTALPSASLFARQKARTVVPKGMVLVGSGVYKALYDNGGKFDGVDVPSFFIDENPVTNAEFLTFVTQNPKWRRSKISPLFAESTYLANWAGDVNLGKLGPNEPVTNVSWFAAKSYAKWKGNRLPTVAEWEYVAGAGTRSARGKDEPGFEKRVLILTNQPTPKPLPDVGQSSPNYWGVRDLHGLVWEWVLNFNSALVTGESRADANLERKLFCGSGVVGASDFTDYAAFMRFAFRGSVNASYSGANLGFRTVRSM
ncbi:MAG: formylglycine-generating enzyme family protein [Bacteroidetes bacterium]|nr:formylglycine-generating enzyme family protein [Bacteroidota bacterium]